MSETLEGTNWETLLHSIVQSDSAKERKKIAKVLSKLLISQGFSKNIEAEANGSILEVSFKEDSPQKNKSEKEKKEKLDQNTIEKKKKKKEKAFHTQTNGQVVQDDPNLVETPELTKSMKNKKRYKDNEGTLPQPEEDQTGIQEEQSSEQEDHLEEQEDTKNELSAKTPSTSKKKRIKLEEERPIKSSSEKKRFQRVNEENALKSAIVSDNRYEATFGSNGYGAKANEKLKYVRGKDFRHEKTKKKRGSYRGGTIDENAINSIDFESDSD